MIVIKQRNETALLYAFAATSTVAVRFTYQKTAAGPVMFKLLLTTYFHTLTSL